MIAVNRECAKPGSKPVDWERVSVCAAVLEESRRAIALVRDRLALIEGMLSAEAIGASEDDARELRGCAKQVLCAVQDLQPSLALQAAAVALGSLARSGMEETAPAALRECAP
jgi:hypothetical protein